MGGKQGVVFQTETLEEQLQIKWILQKKKKIWYNRELHSWFFLGMRKVLLLLGAFEHRALQDGVLNKCCPIPQLVEELVSGLGLNFHVNPLPLSVPVFASRAALPVCHVLNFILKPSLEQFCKADEQV